MKRISFVVLVLNIQALGFNFSYAQNPGEWKWIHGSSSSGSLGNTGIKGVPSPGNDPRALYEACEWTDLNGKFWMFGGLGTTTSDTHNNLWKYDPVTNQWTWMTGSNTINSLGNYGVQ